MSEKFIAIMLVVVFMFLPCGESFGDDTATEENMISRTISQYFEAFNNHDAVAAIANMLRDAEYLAPNSDRIKGADKIKKRLESFFREHGESKIIPITEPKIILYSKTKAVARGVVKTQASDKTSSDIEYMALFSKENNRWKISQIEDQPIASLKAYTKLMELAWLLGEWTNVNGDDVSEVKFDWAPNRSFITGSFKVLSDGNTDMEGTQIIAVDPSTNSLRSWVFDSQGGIGEGTWARDGSGWAVSMVTTLADGQKASAINIFHPDGPDRFIWKSIGRELGGLPLPNIEEILVVRDNAPKNKSDKK